MIKFKVGDKIKMVTSKGVRKLHIIGINKKYNIYQVTDSLEPTPFRLDINAVDSAYTLVSNEPILPTIEDIRDSYLSVLLENWVKDIKKHIK